MRSSSIIVQEHQSRSVGTEHWIADGMIGWTKCRAGVVLQIDMEESTSSLLAEDKAQSIRHMPPTDADHSEVIWTPDGLTRRHFFWQVFQQAVQYNSAAHVKVTGFQQLNVTHARPFPSKVQSK